MATVNAISVSPKSHLTFGSSQNSATISPKMVLGTDEFALSALKSAKPSALKRFFTKAMMGAAVLSSGFLASCEKDPIPEPNPIDPPVTSILSPTQRTFINNFNTMYGPGTTLKAATTEPALVSQFEILEQGNQILSKTYDYSTPDTVKANVQVIESGTGKVSSIYKEKIYLENDVPTMKLYDPPGGELSFDSKKWTAAPFTMKYTVDPADSKVIESINGTKAYKYIPESETKVIQKTLRDGGEFALKILKRVAK